MPYRSQKHHCSNSTFLIKAFIITHVYHQDEALVAGSRNAIESCTILLRNLHPVMAPASFALIVNDNNVFILKHID